jgi:hypothetical protein
MDDAAKILEVLERLETKVDRIDARTSPLEASCNTLSADVLALRGFTKEIALRTILIETRIASMQRSLR